MIEKANLFTVSIKNDGTTNEGIIDVEFDESLLAFATQEELFNELEGEMDALMPMVAKIINLIKSKG
ncbi:hypothetical protein [Clostridium sp. FP1]|uniref:hypothetical protein n=1 Tax=Clostridium sp. FP1 TaxID=2724076 RepID=UPI0013E9629B|nr:hypothetical protein [Clostridium sp. FP1]MBZ9635612.1 hypothetical protein [Clostridium sp. FP1]